MSVKYTLVPSSASHNNESVTLLEEENSPANVRIHPYIRLKKSTLKFDLLVLAGTAAVYVVLLGFLLKFVILPTFHGSIHAKDNYSRSTEKGHIVGGWSNTYKDIASESVIRLLDVNNDGADDIILGLAQPTDLGILLFNQPAYCQQYSNGCLGSVIAVNGRDGSPIWNISTFNEVFALNCGNIDIDKDGLADCLGAGRKGTIVAFNPYEGKLLWTPQTGKERYIEYAWNIYTPLEDITSDGVPEVLIAHGGNPEFPPENTTRFPGRLVLCNGANGQIIGKYVELPDGKETYNSPVLHQDKSGEKYILIGSGGETVEGSLFIIRLTDFVNCVNGISSSFTPIKQLKHIKMGFHRLFGEQSKGIMVPVVLADVNNDNTLDIITSSFDGSIAAFDGDRFENLWIHTISGAESYTTPGIGFFNPDSTLDFMMHWNFGSWPNYNSSIIVVHSGKDGSQLWSYSTTRFSMTSDLVLRTEVDYQDVFVFRVQGREGKYLDSGIGVIHGIDSQRKLIKNSKSGGEKRELISCDENSFDILASEIFLVNWETKEAPVRAFRKEVDKYHYKAKLLKETKHTDLFSERDIQKCTVMEQSSRTTGMIGDLNGDGYLDLVMTFNAQGVITDQQDNYVTTAVSVDLVRLDIAEHYSHYPRIPLRSTPTKPIPINRKQKIKFLPKYLQSWTGYMGNDSLSKYYPN